MPKFPMPNDVIEDQGTVVASVHYGDHDNLATILVLRQHSPFFRVGVWNFEQHEWDGNGVAYEDHMNIVPAIEGEAQHKDGQFTGEHKMGYVDMGGDY